MGQTQQFKGIEGHYKIKSVEGKRKKGIDGKYEFVREAQKSRNSPYKEPTHNKSIDGKCVSCTMRAVN